MNAGKLNSRIVIQRQVEENAPSGQKIGRWIDVCAVWAQVECTDSKTVDGDGYIQHEGLYRFYIRWRQGLDANMRIKWGGRLFTLVGPPADWKTEKSGLTLLAKELI